MNQEILDKIKKAEEILEQAAESITKISKTCQELSDYLEKESKNG